MKYFKYIVYIISILSAISCGLSESKDIEYSNKKLLSTFFNSLKDHDKKLIDIIDYIAEDKYRILNFTNDLHTKYLDSLDINSLDFIFSLKDLDHNFIEALEPMYIWKKFPEDVSKYSEMMRETLEKDNLYQARTIRYALLMTENNNIAHKVLTKEIIHSAKQKLKNLEHPNRIYFQYQVAWYKFMISQAYFIQYKQSNDRNIQILDSAFHNRMDVINERYYGFLNYDSMYFEDMFDVELYFEKLKESKVDSNKFMSAVLDFTFKKPTSENISNLRNYFRDYSSDFQSEWNKFIDEKLINLNAEQKVFIDRELLQSSNQDQWLLIDFWGTWCKPCIEDLPMIQKYHNISLSEQSFSIKTIASRDTPEQVKVFMDRKELNFPVFVDTNPEVSDLFSVNSFPTKLLVNNKIGKYFIIPDGNINWSKYLEGYLLLSLK
ncbi:TlpA family protein disulfide reductase [Marivirga sp.]|uniref:TlpA family protein disulfide reductase n=1 Tax=Marivirga sp. TaxID=2018662 RepID=UPI003DA76BC0